MEHVSQKLQRLRRKAIVLLVAQRLCQWISAVLLIGLVLGLIDFWLRFPGVPRLIIGLTVAAGALLWLVSRVAHAMGFRPSLSTLALRAERMFPHLRGVLASGVEFAVARASGDPAAVGVCSRTDGLVDAAIRDAEHRLDAGGVSLGKLIDPARTLRLALVMMLVLVGFTAVAGAAGGNSLIAAKRWFAPLGDAQWPKRYAIESTPGRQVYAVDEPVRLQALVTRARGRTTASRMRRATPAGRRAS